MRNLLIVATALVLSVTDASPIEHNQSNGVVSGRRIDHKTGLGWDQFNGASYGASSSKKDQTNKFPAYVPQKPTNSPEVYQPPQTKDAKNIFVMKNGKLQEGSFSYLSEVMDSDLYTREVVYRTGPQETIRDPSGPYSADVDELVDLLPVKKTNEPYRVVIYRKKNPVTRLMGGLYEIVSDIFYIVAYTSGLMPVAEEKVDDDERRKDIWPLIRNVFVKYFKLVRESELLAGLRDVLPITHIEKALEKGDGETVWHSLYDSFTPKFFSYAVKAIIDAFFMPFHAYADSLESSNYMDPENREVLESFDLFSPFKNIYKRARKMFGSKTRHYGTSMARSLSSYFFPGYYDYENESTDTLQRSDDVGASESVPLSVVAGLGAVAAASYLAYNSMSSDDVTTRQKRTTIAPLEEYGIDQVDMNIILNSVEDTEEFLKRYLISDKHNTGRSNEDEVASDMLKDILMEKLQSLLKLTHPIAAESGMK